MAPVTIAVWSDILCPFCYIGKRRLEAALKRFPQRDSVKVVWKAFQLNPRAERNVSENIYQHLSKKYGRTMDQVKQMVAHVNQQAASVGLNFDMDRAVLTNSGDAHRLIALANAHGQQDAAQERLMAAYFMEGKHIGDPETLMKLGVEVGLAADDVKAVLEGRQYASNVSQDQQEASAMGVSGVPFFLFNDKFAVSGAQPEDAFMSALEKAWKDLGASAENLDSKPADACGPEGCAY